MVQSRTLTSTCFTLALALQAMWIGCPSVGCVCADGRVKLFCDSLFSAASIGKRARSPETRPCCKHGPSSPRAADTVDCRQQPGRGLSGQGCSRVLETPVLAVVPGSGHLPLDSTLAPESGIAVEFAFAPVSYLSTRRTNLDTGPPTDLVLTLRRLLI